MLAVEIKKYDGLEDGQPVPRRKWRPQAVGQMGGIPQQPFIEGDGREAGDGRVHAVLLTQHVRWLACPLKALEERAIVPLHTISP